MTAPESNADGPALNARPPADAYPPARFVLDCRGQRLDLRPGRGAPKVMGILNVTPDSFSDGGKFLEKDDALRRAEAMLEEGADVIDVGGESSRPAGSVYGEGAAAVAEEEEKQRVLPVVEALAERFPSAMLSVDTYKPGVARAALEAGAHVINDITGLRIHPETAAVCADFGAPLIVMHSLGRPGALPHAHQYEDVVEDVGEALAESVKTAEAAGVRQVVVDPGFGFGKTADENLRLVASTGRFLRKLRRPLLVGISRKSTIGAVLGKCASARARGSAPSNAPSSDAAPVPAHERLFGTLGATAVAALRGATLVRTHDVRATVDMLCALAATLASGSAEARAPG